MIQKVTSFNQIPIIKKSLVVLDIDETIMGFPNITKLWWKETFNKHLDVVGTKAIANKLLVEEWREHVAINKPYLHDKSNLNKFIEEIENNSCQLLFLTARDPKMTKVTHEHLAHCDLAFGPEQVIHNENKGDALASFYQSCSDITNIIFVDDFEKNLLDVKSRFELDDLNHLNVSLYHIAHN
jgi:predicted secreted acid phosphatase